MTAVSVEGVWKEYGEAVILERINLEVEGQAFVSLVGPSGCGKSSLVRTIVAHCKYEPYEINCSLDNTQNLPQRVTNAL